MDEQIDRIAMGKTRYNNSYCCA